MRFARSQLALAGIVTPAFPRPGGLLQGGSLSLRSEQSVFREREGGREESIGASPGGRTRTGESGEGDGERAATTESRGFSSERREGQNPHGPRRRGECGGGGSPEMTASHLVLKKYVSF